MLEPVHNTNLRRTHFHARSPRPQSDAGSNLILGPGGQAALISQQAVASTSPILPAPTQPNPQLQRPSIVASPSVVKLAPSAITTDNAGQPPQQMPLLFSAPPATSATPAAPSSVPASSAITPISQTTSTVVVSQTTAPPAFAISSPVDGTPTSASSSNLSPSSTPVSSISSFPTTSSVAIPVSLASPHSPPFYIGIILGTVVVIAVIAAIIAWCVRLRSHSRKNHAPMVWGSSGGGDTEAARDATSIEKFVIDDGANLNPAWFDPGVGEPKRTESYFHTPGAAGGINRAPVQDSIAYPLQAYAPNTTAATTSPYFHGATTGTVDDQHAQSACTLGPLQVANIMPGDASRYASQSNTPHVGNELGTPREGIPGERPRFWGLEDGGLAVPWADTDTRQGLVGSLGSRPSLVARLRNSSVGNTGTRRAWDELPPLPMPGETSESHQDPNDAAHGHGSGYADARNEGWSASLKLNLVNAFNAVAANIQPVVPPAHADDGLTPLPVRRKSRSRAFVGSTEWPVFVGGERVGPPSRTGTTCSRVSSAWTLEETRAGAGVVHFRQRGEGGTVSSLAGYAGGDAAFASRVSSFSDHSEQGAWGPEQTPLVITKRPQAAVVRPDMTRLRSRVSRYGADAGGLAPPGGLSRASSVYSTMSAVSSVYQGESEWTRSTGPPRLPSFSL